MDLADIAVPAELPPLTTSDDGMDSTPKAAKESKQTSEPTRRGPGFYVYWIQTNRHRQTDKKSIYTDCSEKLIC